MADQNPQTLRFELEMQPLLTTYDGLLMPPAPGGVPDRATTGDATFNAPWSGIGAPFGEPRILAAARWVEAAVGFAVAPPEPAPGGHATLGHGGGHS